MENNEKNTKSVYDPMIQHEFMVNESHNVSRKKIKERKKILLHLIHGYLKDEGYIEAAKSIEETALLSPTYCVCDNVDLETIVQEFETYYFLRFRKYPKLCRITRAPDLPMPRGHCKSARILGSKNNFSTSPVNSRTSEISHLIIGNFEEQQELKIILPPCTPEIQELKDVLCKEILTTHLNVKWSDIIGLEKVKSVLKESIIYPLKYPQIYRGLLAPWKAVLLYGPPGTGKTMLAKAVATESKTTFFNISSSSIVSKWRGESEKLVKALFELAHQNAPSTIFIDEFDCMASQATVEDHEGSRRLRSALQIHLDGLLSLENNQVFVLAATNSPWNLESSMVRRFEKRILVDLPNENDREALFRSLLPTNLSTRQGAALIPCSIDYKHVAKLSDGFTGSDLKLVCRETAMKIARQLINSIENRAGNLARTERKAKKISTKDVEESLSKTKATISVGLLSKYREWEKLYGST